MSNDQLAIALARAQAIGKARFINIGDISCDVEVPFHVNMLGTFLTKVFYSQGGLEFLTRSSTLSSPFYKTRPTGLPAHLPSVQMMAVDILPASLPLDSSRHFSSVLLPYLNTLVQQYRGEDVDSAVCEGLERATVAHHGDLAETHRWLAGSVRAWRESAGLLPSSPSKPTVGSTPGHSQYNGLKQKKRVLMLGSGMVAKPAVDEICKRSDLELLVGMYCSQAENTGTHPLMHAASNSQPDANALTKPHENARSLLIDMKNKEQVGHLVGQADVVIR